MLFKHVIRDAATFAKKLLAEDQILRKLRMTRPTPLRKLRGLRPFDSPSQGWGRVRTPNNSDR